MRSFAAALPFLLASALPPAFAGSSSSSSSSLPLEYEEHLGLRPLPHSALLASFNFRSSTTLPAFDSQNYRFFPRSLAQIIQHASTRELHLRFGLGRWDAERWGARPWGGQREGGTGVELWAWLDAESDAEADDKWLTLTNALSGLFCASLNFIDGTRTTRPVMSFWPEGDYLDDTDSRGAGNSTTAGKTMTTKAKLLHGVLPREVVCTENLTPFLKLLPCKGKAGIASLLNGHKLFDASWQSMAIDVRPVCVRDANGKPDCVLQIEQTIDMVLDIERAKRPRENPIPRPPPWQDLKCDTSKPYNSPNNVCLPIDHLLAPEWSLSAIFGKNLKGTCLADINPANEAPVCINVPSARSVYTSEGSAEVKKEGHVRCWKIRPDAAFEMYLPVAQDDENQEGALMSGNSYAVTPETPLLYAERSLTGHGQEHGAVQTILTNPSPDAEVEFVYMESLPWFMRVYLHSLQARVSGGPTSGSPSSSSDGSAPLIQEMHYLPARDRARGTQLELRMRIPPASTVFLAYDFEKSILRYTEYPPDANRGFDVASAVITTMPSAPGGRSTSLRTTAVLLSLPTPDFSMPYNVIIFTSTAIALTFGGMYNILVRIFVGADEGPLPLEKLSVKAKLTAFVAKLKGARKPVKRNIAALAGTEGG